jgi:hypothetical protein
VRNVLRRGLWAAAAVVVVGVIVVRVAERRTAAPADGRAALAAGLPEDPAERARLKAEMDRLLDERRRTDDTWPRPVLPEDQRTLFVDAWNRMRSCTQAHGFEGVPSLDSSFGDGSAPMPAIDIGVPGAGEAMNACPIDTAAFDADRVRAAMAAARPGG